ncbi:MAG: thiamine-phosphate kinase, partial [Alistipes sp.]|nr:thiamine-phosphate kinase [Alistipes sp.]
MTEFGFIEQLAARFAALPANDFEGIGDDCAVLPIGTGEALLFTTDMLTEGIHFLRAATSAHELGHKSLAVNLSDIA